jgi:PEP-CTERM motif
MAHLPATLIRSATVEQPFDGRRYVACRPSLVHQFRIDFSLEVVLMKTAFNFQLCALALAIFLPVVAVADPIPGRDILKFSQLPMLNTPIPNPNNPTGVEFFHGHDELSTAYSVRNDLGIISGYQGRFMADDFADKSSSPVVHVKWWGSYLNRPTFLPDPTVKRFLVSFERDIPQSAANPFSRPGAPILNQIVSLDTDGVLTPGSGTFTEKLAFPTSVDGPIFEYNAELHLGKEFRQEPNQVYWLKVVALVERIENLPNDAQLQWGWHNRDYTIVDPLASTPPAVVPGEHIDGVIPVAGAGIPIWHFQDDAVDGFVNVVLNTANPIMPIVQQDVRGPNNYLPPFDGPSLIGTRSKDLAFQLFTVPEPASAMLILLGLAAAWARVIRRPM